MELSYMGPEGIHRKTHSSIVEIGVARIKTTVTDKNSDIDCLVKTFLSNDKNMKKIIGLDTERSHQSSGDKKATALIQLCDGDNCLIVQLPCGVRVSSLFNFLNLPDFTFVGIGIQNTLRKLESEFGLTCKNAVEVGPGTWNQHLAVQKRLIRDIVSTQKPSSPIFDDWGNYLLNKDQIQLAAWNAHFAFRIGNLLLDALDYYP
ncbi:hypothetical protein Bca4012_100088 [Brassica carinata]|uniref:3'-5' exonuclease domain-containing protein n=5 Tax=Brassica TaxID=3705 RepID=A0A0D3CVC0_BRAOL|nr:uncharacterized protein LOC106447779 [Brassica napus]KAG2252525.1 hypothetical protein Bca52824_082661 [Brassica carinata]CAF2060048.1 unnamed protein product [Brassica napus]VDD62533.1 unnamed protein product [Brassica oleracea]